MKGEVGKCKMCGVEFIKQRKKHELCSNDCRREYSAKQKEDKEYADFFIFARDEFRCAYCGKSSIEDGVKLVVEHIHPRGSGGANSLYNVVTACWRCNYSKFGHLLPYSVFMRLIQRNKARNKGITKQKRKEIRGILERFYPTEHNQDNNY